MTVTQYLGTGSTSRGRLTITRQLNTIVSTPPYLRTENDKASVIQGLINLQEALKPVANLTWITPRSNVTAEQFINSVSICHNYRGRTISSDPTNISKVPAIPARRGSNHWIGKQPHSFEMLYSDGVLIPSQVLPRSGPTTAAAAAHPWLTSTPRSTAPTTCLLSMPPSSPA